MSRPGFGQPIIVRESLKFEDVIRNQIDACRKVFNEGDPTAIMYAVETLNSLVSPNVTDDQYLSDLQELEDEWKATKRKAAQAYRRELFEAQGGCPDLVEAPPNKPGAEYFKKLFEVCLAVFERHGLGFKQEVIASD